MKFVKIPYMTIKDLLKDDPIEIKLNIYFKRIHQ